MVGVSIKKIRLEKEMTEYVLAEKAGMSPEYIVKVEEGSIIPSISELTIIADVLGVSLEILLASQEQNTVTVIRRDSRTKIKFSDVNLEYDFLTPYGRKKQPVALMEVFEYRLAPKSWVSDEILFHPECAECAFILEGTLEYHVGNETYTVNAGDCFYLPPATTHKLYNPGDIEVRSIAVISPSTI